MRTYASSRVKRKSFYWKSELQMFLLISGGHIGAPKLYANMASPYKALQRCVKLWPTKTWDLDKLFDLSFITFHFLGFFHWTVSNLFFCCVTVKTVYSWKFFPNSVRSHWLLRGHMTSNNKTVSRPNFWTSKIKPFPSFPGPLFQNEGRCSAFDMEIIFHSRANKTHFHKKGWAPSLILKVSVFGTRKWPIAKLMTSEGNSALTPANIDVCRNNKV